MDSKDLVARIEGEFGTGGGRRELTPLLQLYRLPEPTPVLTLTHPPRISGPR